MLVGRLMEQLVGSVRTTTAFDNACAAAGEGAP